MNCSGRADDLTGHRDDRAVARRFYLRVSTARQAEHDVSIPDQKRQGEAYAPRAAINSSRPMWSRAHRPRTTAGPNSSA